MLIILFQGSAHRSTSSPTADSCPPNHYQGCYPGLLNSAALHRARVSIGTSMTETEMKVDAVRAKALVSQLQEVQHRIASVAKGRNVSFFVCV